MKIEIEFSEVEALRKKIKYQEEIIQQQQQKINSLKEEELLKNAEKLALLIAKKYLVATFNSLGFKDTKENDIEFYNIGYYKKWLGDSWQDSKNLKSKISLLISADFKKIFLQLWAEVEGQRK